MAKEPAGDSGADDEGISSGSAGAKEMKEASAKYLAGLTAEERETPLTMPDDEEGDVDDDRPKRRQKKEPAKRDEEGKFAKKKEPAKADDADDDEAELERIEADEKDEADAARLVELEEIPEADRTKEETKELEQLKLEPEETGPKVIVLRGLSERGEEDLELEIEDPAIIERIQRLQNDGLRRQEYNERLDALESQAGELAEAEALIEANPIGFVLDQMAPERQLEVAKALIAQHFEALAPVIDEFFADEKKVVEAKLKYEKDRNTNTEDAQRTIQSRNAARKIERAVLELIPEGTDRDVVSEFMDDAQGDLLRAIKRRERVSPQTVALLLKKRIQMYGFAAKEKDLAGARPVTDRAKALAERTSKAKPEQERIKRTQLARRNARGIAPAGAGAAIVKERLVPKGATVEEATAHLRKSGKLSGSWTDFSRRGQG